MEPDENKNYDVSGLTSSSDGSVDFVKLICIAIVIGILLYLGFWLLLFLVSRA